MTYTDWVTLVGEYQDTLTLDLSLGVNLSMLNFKFSKTTFGDVKNVRECVDDYILTQFKGWRSDTIKVVTVWYTEFKLYTCEGVHIRTDVSIYASQSRQFSEFIPYPFVEYKDNGNMYIRQTLNKRTLVVS